MNKRHTMLFAAALLALAPIASADVGKQWTSIASEAVRDARAAPEVSSRHLATVNEAMAAAAAATRANGNGNGNGGSENAPLRERHDAAVAVAAFAVLESLYPDQREYLESRLALAFSFIPETAAKAEGAALGRRIASGILAARK